MKQKLLLKLILPLLLSFKSATILAQSDLKFELKTSPNVGFVFNTIEKYQQGLVIPSVVTLRVNATNTKWDLYIGTNTAVGGNFDVTNSYGTSGSSSIPVGILQARVYNASNTSLTGSSFFNLTDIATPTYLIGSNANDASITCGNHGTNVAGSYVTQPQCYTFKVDLKAAPGLSYKAGLYGLRIDFILIEDL